MEQLSSAITEDLLTILRERELQQLFRSASSATERSLSTCTPSASTTYTQTYAPPGTNTAPLPPRSTAVSTNINTSSSSSTSAAALGSAAGEAAPLPKYRRHFVAKPRKRKANPKSKQSYGAFWRDVILLPNPSSTSIPRQGTKEWLNSNGFIIKGVQFERGWSNQELMAKLKSLFAGKLTPSTSLQICQSMHSRIGTVNIEHGQEINGMLLAKCFGYKKPVYLLPTTTLLDTQHFRDLEYKPLPYNFEDDPDTMPITLGDEDDVVIVSHSGADTQTSSSALSSANATHTSTSTARSTGSFAVSSATTGSTSTLAARSTGMTGAMTTTRFATVSCATTRSTPTARSAGSTSTSGARSAGTTGAMSPSSAVSCATMRSTPTVTSAGSFAVSSATTGSTSPARSTGYSVPSSATNGSTSTAAARSTGMTAMTTARSVVSCATTRSTPTERSAGSFAVSSATAGSTSPARSAGYSVANSASTSAARSTERTGAMTTTRSSGSTSTASSTGSSAVSSATIRSTTTASPTGTLATTASTESTADIIGGRTLTIAQSDAEVPITNTHSPRSDLLADIMASLRQSIDTNKAPNKINVFRFNIWEGAMMGFGRRKFKDNAPLSVIFYNNGDAEGAVDLGGPKRELFTLCLKEMSRGPCFVGDDKKILTRDRAALDRREYFVCGKIMALSLIHEGPAPHFLSPVLFKALTDGPSSTQATVDDMPACEVKQSMLELRDMKNPDDFLAALEKPEHKALATTIDNGGTFIQSISSSEDIRNILNNTAQYYVVGRSLDAFEQFKDGLSTMGVLEAVTQHPGIFEPLLSLSPEPMTNDVFARLFQVERSEKEEWRAAEGRVVCHWQQFLQRIEDEDCEVSYEDVLMFTTGVRNIPPLGLECTVNFQHTPGLLSRSMSKYPLANTCTLALTLPTIHKTYAQFEQAMEYAILNAQVGFAFA